MARQPQRRYCSQISLVRLRLARVVRSSRFATPTYRALRLCTSNLRRSEHADRCSQCSPVAGVLWAPKLGSLSTEIVGVAQPDLHVVGRTKTSQVIDRADGSSFNPTISALTGPIVVQKVPLQVPTIKAKKMRTP